MLALAEPQSTGLQNRDSPELSFDKSPIPSSAETQGAPQRCQQGHPLPPSLPPTGAAAFLHGSAGYQLLSAALAALPAAILLPWLNTGRKRRFLLLLTASWLQVRGTSLLGIVIISFWHRPAGRQVLCLLIIGHYIAIKQHIPAQETTHGALGCAWSPEGACTSFTTQPWDRGEWAHRWAPGNLCPPLPSSLGSRNPQLQAAGSWDRYLRAG